ncbi:hypothetical protein C2S51_009309 [Perilla frutescens var. frutescens]|nr:hypothetical protein C2S51_009309 [Perilla frutescens var. frutescens]
MVATFLIIVGHKDRYCNVRQRFSRSHFATSQNFNKVLKALNMIAPDMMVKPSISTPAKIQDCTRFMPFFKDCIRTIDGTHIPATITGREVSSFHNRHGMQSQNVLAACNFDLQFIYVLSGWEGSSHDSKLLSDALSRTNGLQVPQGKYFLVDCGFANRRQFLAPLRGVRYHLEDFGGQGRHPGNAKCRSDEFPVEYERDEDLPPPPPEEENMECLSQCQLQQRTEANTWRMSIANAMWEARPTYNGDGNDDDKTEDENAE